jgi:hypothetical protein
MNRIMIQLPTRRKPPHPKDSFWFEPVCQRRVVYRGSPSLDSHSCVDVGLAASCHMASRGWFGCIRYILICSASGCRCVSSSLNSDSRVDVATIEVASLASVCSIMSYGVPRLVFALFGILCWLRDDRRHDARHFSASIVLYGVPKLVSLF